MMSQLFALPMRALIVASALPTPPAQGATFAGPGGISRPSITVSLDDHRGFALEARVASHSTSPSSPHPAGR